MKNKNNYIVSGIRRSGTSMMMNILQEGGIDIVYNKNIDEERKKNINWGEPSYDPNPNGCFEFSNKLRIEELQELMKKTEDKAIKILNPYILDHLPVRNYKIIYMLRNLEEIRLSQQISFVKRSIDSGTFNKEQQIFLDEDLPLILNKEGIETLFVQYKVVIENPKREIEKISKFLEIDLDLEKATRVINTKLYRWKI